MGTLILMKSLQMADVGYTKKEQKSLTSARAVKKGEEKGDLKETKRDKLVVSVVRRDRCIR